MLKKKLHAIVLTLFTISSTCMANEIDSQSNTSNVSNESSQYSQGIVSNNPTYVNNGGYHAYSSIGKVSCAQASMNVGVAASGEDYVNSGSIYMNVNIPFTSFGSGISCAEAMAEAKAQMEYDTAMVLTDHCLALLSKGFSYHTSNPFSRKCEGFQLTGIGKEMVETQKANLIAEQKFADAKANEALANELEQQIRRHDLCKAAKDRGMNRMAFCQGVHIASKDD